MAKMFSEKAQTVLRYLQDHQGEQLTANMIAEATGLSPRSVNGTLTGLQKETAVHPGLTTRTEVEGVEGKVIGLTAAGIAADPDADKPEKDAE